MTELVKIMQQRHSCREFLDKAVENEKIVDTQFIPIQKVKDKISERQFELQQEYKDFEDDAILTVLQELIEMKY